MDTISWDIIFKIAGIVAIIFLASIASAIFRHVKLDQFGSDNDSKRKVSMKLIAYLFIFLGICLILIAGIFGLFHEQVNLLLFVSGLTALGIKIVSDLKK